MAANNIKGLIVEIGGDTSKLGDALKDVEKKSRSLSSELGDINRLLKMDPGNAELLAQKQKVLADAISSCADKLETLKKAEKQVQEQFEKGEASEEQVRALQREIIATESKMQKYASAATETADAIKRLGDGSGEAEKGLGETGTEAGKAAGKVDDFADSADKAEKSGDGLGKTLASAAKAGLAAIGAAAGAAVAGLVGAAESTREYRAEMSKLDTAFTMNGHSAEAAKGVYQELQGVLGETDQAVEASNHLAQLCKDEEQLATMTEAMTGVYAMFGDSLPLEGLAEAANESAKTGAVTGSLADALNWASVSSKRWALMIGDVSKPAQDAFNEAIKEGANTEDAFNEALSKCSTEQERAALITRVLSGAYQEEAWAFQEANAEVIRANKANDEWMQSLSGVGGAIDPIITDVKLLGASMVAELVPGVQQVADAFRGLLNGEDGAAANLGAALSGLITQLVSKVTELLPTVIQVGISLISTLATTLVEQLPTITAAITQAVPMLIEALLSMLPVLIEGLIQMSAQIIQSLAAMLPGIVQAIVAVVPLLIDSLLANLPVLLDACVTLLMALVDAIPILIESLVVALPKIIESLVSFFTNNIDKILQAAIKLLMALVDAIPKIVDALVQNLPQIITAIVSGVVSAIPQLLSAAIELFWTLLTAAGKLLGELPGMLQKIGGAIFDGIMNALPAIGKAAADIWNTIWTAIKEMPGKMLDFGKNLVQGLWDGIINSLSWIKSKISGWVGDVLGFIKGLFGIHSPSTETAWMGEMLDKGLAGGIEDHAKDPLKAMQRLSKDVLGEADEMNGLTLERSIHTNYSNSAQAAAENSMLGKLDGILEAIKAGQVLAIDGKLLVGGTASAYDNALGQRRLLAARGAI